MPVRTGLDQVVHGGWSQFAGQRIGIVCNQASVDSSFVNILDTAFASGADVRAIFGPQHGLFGTTQDNMIEWGGGAVGSIPAYSLYGEHRKPTPEMLAGLDRLVIDVVDVGSRYYTFVWTMAHCMEACAELGIAVTILDRPNPIGGVQVEGPVLEPEFSSFVGLYPVPTRHGMNVGEIARYLQSRYLPNADLEVIACEGWDRQEYGAGPFALPSPNMPTIDTAIVYPGGCLLEATNLSEGRGTTKPFEMFGAPFLDGRGLAASLNALELPGCKWRAVQFEPTFNKYARRVCEGVFLHVLDRKSFLPVLSYIAAIQECIRQTGLRDSSTLPQDDRFVAESRETQLDGFAWKQPPYEYVYDRMPIDILAGNAWLRPAIERLTPLSEIEDRMAAECRTFSPWRDTALG